MFSTRMFGIKRFVKCKEMLHQRKRDSIVVPYQRNSKYKYKALRKVTFEALTSLSLVL